MSLEKAAALETLTPTQRHSMKSEMSQGKTLEEAAIAHGVLPETAKALKDVTPSQLQAVEKIVAGEESGVVEAAALGQGMSSEQAEALETLTPAQRHSVESGTIGIQLPYQECNLRPIPCREDGILHKRCQNDWQPNQRRISS